MGRLEQKKKLIKSKKVFRRKKILVFLLILLFFEGIVLVDNEYSNMMGYEREMVLGCKRINSEIIKIYLLGKEIDINNKEVMKNIENASDTTVTKTKVFFYKMKRKIQLLFTTDDFNPKGTRQI